MSAASSPLLIPEFYKFGRTLSDFTLSSLAGWPVVSVVSWASTVAIHRYVASMSLATVLSGATIGKAVFGALPIGCYSSVSMQGGTPTPLR